MSESAHASAPAEPPDRPRDELASLAGQFRHAATGVQARLRRVNPCRDGRGAVFETELLLHGARLQPRDDEDRRRWALVLHCLALADGRHDSRAAGEPGAVLQRLSFKEGRLRQLLEADFDVLVDLMPRVARRLGAAGATVNWWPLAELLLHTGTGDPVRRNRADAARRRLVEHYLQAAPRETSADVS